MLLLSIITIQKGNVMKHSTISMLSMILAIVMIVIALASCGGGNVDVTTESTEQASADTNEQTTEANSNITSEKLTETVSEDVSENTSENITEEKIENPHSELIETADSLLNQVQGGFTDGMWREFNISNDNMSLRYVLSRDRDQRVGYIKNSNGASYIENTMDVFVKMTDGYTSYASKSTIGRNHPRAAARIIKTAVIAELIFLILLSP